MFVMIRDGLFNSTSPHVGIHLHSLSGVNGVFARLALKVFEDTRPDVMCIQPPALLLLIDLLSFCLLHGCFHFSSFCHIFSNLNRCLDETLSVFLVCMFQELALHTTASIKRLRRPHPTLPPNVILFFPLKSNGKKMVPWYLYTVCVL